MEDLKYKVKDVKEKKTKSKNKKEKKIKVPKDKLEYNVNENTKKKEVKKQKELTEESIVKELITDVEIGSGKAEYTSVGNTEDGEKKLLDRKTIIIDSAKKVSQLSELAYAMRMKSATISLSGCNLRSDDGSRLFSMTEYIGFIVPCHVEDKDKVSKELSQQISSEMKEIKDQLSKKVEKIQEKQRGK